jgi:glycosyltransferase involved in cell wall biosynthesis
VEERIVTPLVSIVVIFLDAERFLAEALESVLAQTLQDFELLLVDDGSSDGSTAIARGFAERLGTRGHYLEHPGHANRGMSASRNLGMRHARGRYVALLDADDVWLPHKLARQVTLLEAAPDVGLVFGQPEYWYGWTGRPEDRRRNCVPELGAPADQVVEPPGLLTRLYPLGTRTAPCPSDLFFRREVASASAASRSSSTTCARSTRTRPSSPRCTSASACSASRRRGSATASTRPPACRR